MSRQQKFLEILEKKYVEKAQEYRSYSYRAFAQFIEVDASSLHKIRKSQRKVGEKLMRRILRKLGLSETDILEILKAN